MNLEQRLFKCRGSNTIYKTGFLKNGNFPIYWTNSSGESREDFKTINYIETMFNTGDWYFIDDDFTAFSEPVSEVVSDEVKSEEIQGIHVSALNKQVSGNHYKDCGIQPIEYIHANGLNYFEGNAVKYITRHRKKNGKADIEKAIHYLELLLEMEYKEQ